MSNAVVAFRRLAVVTATFAYLQIALGGLVRVSGSGLGCPDWPLCHGRPYPPPNIHSIIEYSHRAVGSVTGILLIGTVVLAWIVFRQRRPLVAWLASASLIGIVGEGLLGAQVVAHTLASWLVLIHLGLAMIIIGFLIATAVMAMPARAAIADAGYTRLAFLAVAGTYLLLLTGSSVVATSADDSCRAWPLCGSGFSISLAGQDGFTMLHRGAVVLIGLLLLHVLSSAVRRRRDGGIATAAGFTLAAFVIQVAIGAAAAITGAALFNGVHVALATAVWAGMVTTAMLTLQRADVVAEPGRIAVPSAT